MSKAGSKSMAGMAMAIPSLLNLIFYWTSQSHFQGACYMHAHSDLVEPRSLVSTGEPESHGHLALRDLKGLIASRNRALPELKSLYVHTCMQTFLLYQLIIGGSGPDIKASIS